MKIRKALAITSAIFALTLGTAGLTACSGGTFHPQKNISVVTREDGSGTKSAFMEIIGLKGKADVSGVIIGQGTAGVLTEVKGNPHAVAYESLGYVNKSVKTLTVDGVASTVENIKNGTYKIARPLNVVYKESNVASGQCQAYLEFLQSADAQTVISDGGYVSTREGATAYVAKSELRGNVKISGSTSLQPLMLLLAQAFETLQPNVTVTVGAGGSGTGYADGQNNTSDFGMISETFNPDKATDCTYYEVAKDGIAIIVNTKNTLTDVSKSDLKNIYNREQSDETKIKIWAQVGQND